MSGLKDTIEVLGSAIIVKVVVQWSSTQLGRLLHWALVRTERDVIIWTHYKKKALRRGHQLPNPVICNDGKCAEV